MTVKLDNGSELEVPFGVKQIEQILPHRYPFLLVDKVLELELPKRIKGLKNVTRNEEFFNGHFPGEPMMPGALIVESAAQVAGILLYLISDNAQKLAVFRGIEHMKFRKPVLPGDSLIHEAEVLGVKSYTGKVATKSTVDDKVVAEGVLTFALIDR